MDTGTLLMMLRREMVAALQARRQGFAFDPAPGQKLARKIAQNFQAAGLGADAAQQAVREMAHEVARTE